MNGKWKIVSGTVLTIFALLSAGWGLNKQFVPREVYNIEMAALSKQTLLTQLLSERFYWQQRVDQLTNECLSNPADSNRRRQLEEAKRKRDEADRRIRELQAK